MHITWNYRLTNIIIEAYLHVHYDYVFRTKIMTTNAELYINMPTCFVHAGIANTYT